MKDCNCGLKKKIEDALAEHKKNTEENGGYDLHPDVGEALERLLL